MAGASVGGIVAGRAFVIIEAIDKSGKVLNSISRNLDGWARRMSKIGQVMLGAGIAGGIPMAASVKEYTAFDDIMRQIQAKGPVASDQLAEMANMARQLGRTSRYAATDIAKMMLALTTFGFKPEEVMSMTKPVADFAAAAGKGNPEDAEIAGELVANILRQYKKPASETTSVVNQLAAVVNETSFNLDDLANAMSYAGAEANQFNLSLDETLALVGLLRNLGAQASSVGTNIRNMMVMMTDKKSRDDFNEKLSSMNGTTLEFVDSAGNLNSVIDILFSMNKAFEGLGTAQIAELLHEMFTIRTGAGTQKAITDIEGLTKLITNIRFPQTTAANMAKTIEGGLGGAIRRLINNLKDLEIELGSVYDQSLRSMVDGITNVIRETAMWIGKNKEVAVQYAMLVGGTIALGASLVTLSIGLRVISTLLSPIAVAAGLLSRSMYLLVTTSLRLYGGIILLGKGFTRLLGFIGKLTVAFRVLSATAAALKISRFVVIGAALLRMVPIIGGVLTGAFMKLISVLIGIPAFIMAIPTLIAGIPALIMGIPAALAGIPAAIAAALVAIKGFIAALIPILIAVTVAIGAIGIAFVLLRPIIMAFFNGLKDIFNKTKENAVGTANIIVDAFKGVGLALSFGQVNQAWEIMCELMVIVWERTIDSLLDIWERFRTNFIGDIEKMKAAWELFMKFVNPLGIKPVKIAPDPPKNTDPQRPKTVTEYEENRDTKKREAEDLQKKLNDLKEALAKAKAVEKAVADAEAKQPPKPAPKPRKPQPILDMEQQGQLAEAQVKREAVEAMKQRLEQVDKDRKSMLEDIAVLFRNQRAGANNQSQIEDREKKLNELSRERDELSQGIANSEQALQNLPDIIKNALNPPKEEPVLEPPTPPKEAPSVSSAAVLAIEQEIAAVQKKLEDLNRFVSNSDLVIDALREKAAEIAGIDVKASKARDQSIADKEKALRDRIAALEKQAQYEKDNAEYAEAENLAAMDLTGDGMYETKDLRKFGTLENEEVSTTIPRMGGPIEAKTGIEATRGGIENRANAFNASIGIMKDQLEEAKKNGKKLDDIQKAIEDLLLGAV